MQWENTCTLLHSQSIRHRLRFTLSVQSCWSSASWNLVILLPRGPPAWPCGTRGEICSLCFQVCILQLWGQSAWQMDAGRAWKVESSGLGRTIHRSVCLQKRSSVPSQIGAPFCVVSWKDAWWTNENYFAGSFCSGCLAYPASCTDSLLAQAVAKLLQFVALYVLWECGNCGLLYHPGKAACSC